MAALTFIQKKIICDIAREAYDAWAGRGEFERNQSEGVNGFDAWRHGEQLRAVGHRSLNHCSDQHYDLLREHFMRRRAAALVDTANLQLF